MTLAQRTIKNSLYNVIGWMWPIGLILVVTPYIVHRLGTDAYGILAIVSTVMGYFAFLNLGLGEAVVKYVAEYHAKKEFEAIHKVIGSTLVVYLILGFAGMTVLSGLTNLFATKVFKMPMELIEVAKFAFYLASVGFLVNMVSSVYSAVPRALQRFDVANKISVVFGTLTSLLTVLLLYLGYWLKAVVVLNFCIGLAALLTYMVVGKKLIPQSRLGLAFDKRFFKKLFSFGIYSTFSRLSGIVTYQVDRLLVGVMVGTTGLTFYAIPQRLISRIQGFAYKLSEIIFPISSELSSTGQSERLKGIYFKVAKMVLSLNIALFLPTILFSYKILYFWMGKEFADRGWMVMVFLGCANFAISCTMIPGLMNLGHGRPGVNAAFASITAVINLAVLYPLLKHFGISGAALAVLFSAIQVPVAIAYSNRKVIGVSNIDFLTKVYSKPFAVGVLQATAIEFILLRFVSSIWTLLPLFFASILLYFALAYLVGVFDESEKKVMIDFARAVFAR